MKYKFLNILLLLGSILFYVAIHGYAFTHIIEADSWIHVSKAMKYAYDSWPFSSPIFLEDFNHYLPLVYFITNIFAVFFQQEIIFSYGIMWLVLKVLNSFIFLICTRRLLGCKSSWLITIFFLIDPGLSFEMNPNVFCIAMIALLIFLTTLKKISLALITIFLFTISMAHIFFGAFAVFFLLVYFLLKKFIFIHKYLSLTFYKKNFIYINIFIINLILIFFFFKFSEIRWFLMSEISINPAVNPIGLLGIWFSPFILSKVPKESFLATWSLTLIYIVMIFFYFSWFWDLFSQYYTSFFIKLILVPWIILFFYNYFYAKRTSFISLFVFISLVIFPILYSSYANIEKYRSDDIFRGKSISEFVWYKGLFWNKVLFFDPWDFLNRFSVVDFGSYIYSSTYGYYEKTTSRPFTTLSQRNNDFPQFFHQEQRLILADNFLTKPNLYSFWELDKYKLDYFIIHKKNSIINKWQNYNNVHKFLRENTKTIWETKNYIIYQKY